MLTSSILGLLVKEVGQPAAEKIWRVVSGKEHATQLDRAAKTMKNGATAFTALREAFYGVDFLHIINDSFSSEFTFDAGTADYISLNMEGKDPIEVLKTELDTNLGRMLTTREGVESRDILNYFKGVFKVWCSRFISISGVTDQEQKVLEKINELLDGHKRSNREVLLNLVAVTNWVTGFCLFVRAYALMTGVGLGFSGGAVIWLFGVPTLQLFISVIFAVILICAGWEIRRRGKGKFIMSLCVSMAYQLLAARDKRQIGFRPIGAKMLKTNLGNPIISNEINSDQDI